MIRDPQGQETFFKTGSRILQACVANDTMVRPSKCTHARAVLQGCKHVEQGLLTAGEVGLSGPRLHRTFLSRHASHHLVKIAQSARDRSGKILGNRKRRIGVIESKGLRAHRPESRTLALSRAGDSPRRTGLPGNAVGPSRRTPALELLDPRLRSRTSSPWRSQQLLKGVHPASQKEKLLLILTRITESRILRKMAELLH
jgi:hypothetical protein